MKTPIFLSIPIVLIFSSAALGQAERVFEEWDKNGDGFLVREEIPEGPRRIFDRKDANGDGKISLAEHLGQAKPEPRDAPAENAAFSIRQTWDQEPDGFDRPVYVSEPENRDREVSVVIFFHGGGGKAGGSIRKWSRLFPKHLVVAPQGYLGFWNVQGERSKAPDVTLFKQLLKEIDDRYDYADMESVSLIGSSNGAAYIYRLLIEVEEDLFRSAVPLVSSLLESQHHDGAFWKSADESETDDLDTKASPVKSGRRILYLHGTDDRTVPFDGGLRFGKFKHHSAQATANILARHFGYSGEDHKPGDGRKIAEGLIRHDYAKTEFSFVVVEGGGHGLQPHQNAANELIVDFIGP